MPRSANSRIAPDKLMRAIRAKGWTFHQAAQLARRHLPSDARLSHTSVWSYATGRATPKRMSYIEAIEKAVGVEPNGLSGQVADEIDGDFPDAERSDAVVRPAPGDGREHVLSVRDLGEGVAHVEVQVVTSWNEALSVLNMLCKRARSTR